jgi:SnoaL-like domain
MDHDAIPVADALVVLRRALPGLLSGDLAVLELFTDDVTARSPTTAIRSRTQLEHQVLDRQGALSRTDFAVDDVAEEPGGLVVSWRMSADHSGDLLFDEDELFEPSGVRVTLSGTTRVRFRGGRICWFETTYDDRDLFDQLRGDLPPDPR